MAILTASLMASLLIGYIILIDLEVAIFLLE